jgi:hypothetical protein
VLANNIAANGLQLTQVVAVEGRAGVPTNVAEMPSNTYRSPRCATLFCVGKFRISMIGDRIMSRLLLTCAMATGLFLSHPMFAQAPATVTATCKDGTPFSGTTRSGACRGHGGVQAWGTSASPTPAPGTVQAQPPTSTTPAAAAGGAGQVWVNTASKVYHCPGDRYYGKTKQGTYMTEAGAKAEGDRPSRGKACS